MTVFGTPVSIASAPTAQAQTNQATSTPIVEDALACNCYSFIASLVPGLPHAAQLKPNTTPHVGSVAIFNYNGLPHYGIVVKMQNEGFLLEDSNFVHCKYMTHLIGWNDSHIVGFWDM